MTLLKATFLTLGALTLFLPFEMAAAGHPFYRTIDNRVEIDKRGHAVFNVESPEEASRSKASRPAEEDVEGHWSPVTRGFQLSLRFDNEPHVTGEPVMATLLVRNTTSHTLYFDTISGNDAPFDFLIVNDQRKLVPPLEKPVEIISGSIKRMDVDPGMQRRYKVRLDDKFSLDEKGTYAVTAKMKVSLAGFFGAGSPQDIELATGNTLLQIVSSLPVTPGRKKDETAMIKTDERSLPPPSQPTVLSASGFLSPEVKTSTGVLVQSHSAGATAAPSTSPAPIISETSSIVRPRDKFFGMLILLILFATGAFLCCMRMGENYPQAAQTK